MAVTGRKTFPSFFHLPFPGPGPLPPGWVGGSTAPARPGRRGGHTRRDRPIPGHNEPLEPANNWQSPPLSGAVTPYPNPMCVVFPSPPNPPRGLAPVLGESGTQGDSIAER